MRLTNRIIFPDNDKLCKEPKIRKFFSSLQNNNTLITFNPI